VTRQPNNRHGNSRSVDALIDEILVDTCGEDEELWAFHQVFADEVRLPADAFVIGEPVSVVKIDYDGNTRLGLTARCRKQDGSSYVVALVDVVFPEAASGFLYVSAYRRWVGLPPLAGPGEQKPGQQRRHKAADEDIDLSGPVELVVLSVKKKAARCRLPGTERQITLRSSDIADIVPGETITVQPRKRWRFAGHPYLSGKVLSQRLDLYNLALKPLQLHHRGTWDPDEEYWGEPDEPIPHWARPIIARGPRPLFEMEQIIPGCDLDDPFDDPIIQSNDLKAAGDLDGARSLLMGLLSADLRCLDAHAHLGNLVLDYRPEVAKRHYEIGRRIGELSLGQDFDGVLAWGLIDNRPYLRCLHGYGLCLWRLGQFQEAEKVFERLLWLSPSDNLGARFLLEFVRSKKSWENYDDDG